jgi:hypothetical protein
MVTTKPVPDASLDSKDKVPPCASTISLVM